MAGASRRKQRKIKPQSFKRKIWPPMMTWLRGYLLKWSYHCKISFKHYWSYNKSEVISWIILLENFRFQKAKRTDDQIKIPLSNLIPKANTHETTAWSSGNILDSWDWNVSLFSELEMFSSRLEKSHSFFWYPKTGNCDRKQFIPTGNEWFSENKMTRMKGGARPRSLHKFAVFIEVISYSYCMWCFSKWNNGLTLETLLCQK